MNFTIFNHLPSLKAEGRFHNTKIHRFDALVSKIPFHIILAILVTA